MGGLFAPLSRKYLVESNKESGYGRYDHILVPETNNPSNIAFILEYKVCQEEDKLETEAELGLNQVEENRYDTQVRQNSQVKKIIKLCLAFWKKKVILKYKEEEV